MGNKALTINGHRGVKRTIFFRILMLAFWIFLSGCGKSADQRYQSLIAGEAGTYWDIFYSQNRQRQQVIQGYCFRADGTFYSYHYYHATRTPFLYGLADTSQDTTIEANLRPWKLYLDDSIQIDFLTYKIQYRNSDTLILGTGVAVNPTIKLVRVAREQP